MLIRKPNNGGRKSYMDDSEAHKCEVNTTFVHMLFGGAVYCALRRHFKFFAD